MPDLNTKQRRFQAAILTGDTSEAAALVQPTGTLGVERLAIYRNHFQQSLVETLGAAYPETQSLVGDRYFSTLAKRYISAEPPTDPRLRRYGSGLARVIAESPECATFPYLFDVARLEWALREAADASDQAPLDVGEVCRALDELGTEAVLTFSTPLRLLRCSWSVDLLWQAHAGPELGDAIQIEQGTRWLEISRDERGPFFTPIPGPEFALLERLLAGDSIAAAFAAAFIEKSALEMSHALSDLIQRQAIVAVAPCAKVPDSEGAHW